MPTVLRKQGLYLARTVQTQGDGAHLVFVIGDDTAIVATLIGTSPPSFTKDQQSRFDNSGAGVLPSDRGLSNDNPMG